MLIFMIGWIGLILFFVAVASCCCLGSDDSSKNTSSRSSTSTGRRNNYSQRSNYSYSECPSCGAPYFDGYCEECGYPDINQGWLGENY